MLVISIDADKDQNEFLIELICKCEEYPRHREDLNLIDRSETLSTSEPYNHIIV